MTTQIQKVLFTLLAGSICLSGRLNAQCPNGFTQASLNWDFHYFKTPPASGTNFMFGVNSVQVSWASSMTINGVNGTETGTSGAGYKQPLKR